MVVVPPGRLLPFTVIEAVAEVPDAVSAAEPSETPAPEKLTLPVGAALPVEGLTVAVKTTVAD